MSYFVIGCEDEIQINNYNEEYSSIKEKKLYSQILS